MTTHGGLLEDLRLAPLEHPEVELEVWYRNSASYPSWLPADSRLHVEQLVSSRSENDPWLTVAMGNPEGAHTYTQVLGADSAHLLIEGGYIDAFGVELTWRLHALPAERIRVLVGPSWYSQPVWRDSVLTAHDALQVLWPSLRAGAAFLAPAGFSITWRLAPMLPS